ncbi:MAG: hypothetical protein CO128_02445 [Ignavibacteriales bacterium CG_4_9_14_3_um_filter_30_11]|nr:MAG: hypothetical protein CO128_02445 [Ignavibacteriales bacterium CG_4_9_14_3_um_filter_30_11]
MIIQKIIKKDDRNVIVHLDNGENLFLSKEVILKNGLRKGDIISDDKSISLIEENQSFFIRQKAFTLLGRRPHSKYELKIKLKLKKYDNELINNLLDELESKNYLNDHEFALAFARDKQKFKHFGSFRIRNELLKKRVDIEIIEETLDEIFPDGNDADEAVYHLNKKIKNRSKIDLNEKKNNDKLMAFLIRKGFDYETAKEALNRVK